MYLNKTTLISTNKNYLILYFTQIIIAHEYSQTFSEQLLFIY